MKTKRLSLNMPKSLHELLKKKASEQNTTMTDLLVSTIRESFNSFDSKSYGEKDPVIGNIEELVTQDCDFVIKMPPRKGKTTLATFIMNEYMKDNEGKKILYLSYSLNKGRDVQQSLSFDIDIGDRHKQIEESYNLIVVDDFIKDKLDAFSMEAHKERLNLFEKSLTKSVEKVVVIGSCWDRNDFIWEAPNVIKLLRGSSGLKILTYPITRWYATLQEYINDPTSYIMKKRELYGDHFFKWTMKQGV